MGKKRRYTLVPLTPVHVGSGVSVGPEEYYLDGDYFVRFGAAHVFGMMTDAERRRYEQMVDGASYRDGIELVRLVAKRNSTASTLYRIPIGKDCTARLGALAEQRENAVQAMAHAGESGDALIPGTAIKGAIRTALLSEWLQQKPSLLERTSREVTASAGARTAIDSRDLEGEIMGVPRRTMEADPFRFLTVRDTPVKSTGFCVDRFEMLGRDGQPKSGQGSSGGVSMFGERLLSVADRVGVKKASVGVVEIVLDEGKQRDARVEGVTKGAAKIGWDDLEAKTRGFYKKRLEEELDRFCALYEWLKPDEWKLATEHGLLLRLGRHAHFEASSLDGIRRGWQIMPRPGRAITMGSTRTVCTLRDGVKKAPMGWVWLCPRDDSDE
jgi:CRISPR-associated protein Csm5